MSIESTIAAMSDPLTNEELEHLETLGHLDLRLTLAKTAAAEISWRRAEAEEAIEHAMIAAWYIGKLEAENARLREYAQHISPCATVEGWTVCTCGLDAVLKEASEPAGQPE